IALMSITSIATGVLTLSLWFRRPRPHWPRTPVRWAWAAWAVALVIATLFAIDPASSAFRLKKALFPSLVSLAAFHTPGRGPGRVVLATLLTSSAVAAVYGIVFFVARGASFASRARGPTGHYMTFGGQLLLWLSVAIAVAVMAPERRWKLFA